MNNFKGEIGYFGIEKEVINCCQKNMIKKKLKEVNIS
jgi:hypothetical protein